MLPFAFSDASLQRVFKNQTFPDKFPEKTKLVTVTKFNS